MAKVDLSGVRLRKCAKPQCKRKGRIDRHHLRHEAMWIGIFNWRISEDRYQQLLARYQEFREEDCVELCDRHHAEIHAIYDLIIQTDKRLCGRPLSKYTWRQADALMSKLKAACQKWLGIPSRGISERTLEIKRRVMRKRK